MSDFDYVLPAAAIARHPAARRDGSRLMSLARRRGTVTHHSFGALADLLRPGDLLVVNDTRVRPARLWCRKAATGGRVEILLIEPTRDAERDGASVGGGSQRWLALAQSSKPLKAGTELTVEGGDRRLDVVERRPGGWVELAIDGDVDTLTEKYGQLPLPPYMDRAPESADADRYQTIFARADRVGSVAAPTAGLHFTDAVLDALRARGVRRAAVTLHVGPGTFLPVRAEDPDDHEMHAERFFLSAETAAAIAQTRSEGGRIVAVGTTVTRVLESLDDPTIPAEGGTDLFIRPGFTFRQVDALITNFHLPRSTLLMLVCAFAGRESVLGAYAEAVDAGYRFYSYGDAMLIQ